MAVRDDRSDVKQTTTGFRGPLMVQSLTSAKSKFLSLRALLFKQKNPCHKVGVDTIAQCLRKKKDNIIGTPRFGSYPKFKEIKKHFLDSCSNLHGYILEFKLLH